jgi:putative alpha-1,2-mannosidase
MFKQGKKILLGAGVLAALSFGGSALAAAGAAPVAPVVQHSSSADGDQIQSGDQTTADTGSQAAEPAGSTQLSGDTETQDGTQGAADTETQDGTQESAGSEVAGNDGPGGHADEPGNPNANHQATGTTQE